MEAARLVVPAQISFICFLDKISTCRSLFLPDPAAH
jgi:hypothetical protein